MYTCKGFGLGSNNILTLDILHYKMEQYTQQYLCLNMINYSARMS